MERSMEELERQAATKMSSILKTNEENDDLDDGVICDVCRSVRRTVDPYLLRSCCHRNPTTNCASCSNMIWHRIR